MDGCRQHLVGLERNLPDLLLLVGHEVQNGLQYLVKTLNYDLFEVVLAVGYLNFGVQLGLKEGYKQFQKIKRRYFRIHVGFSLCNLYQDRQNLIDYGLVDDGLKLAFDKLFGHFFLKVFQALLCADFQLLLFIAEHEEEILQYVGQILQQVHADDFIEHVDPSNQKLADRRIHALELGLQNAHELFNFE